MAGFENIKSALDPIFKAIVEEYPNVMQKVGQDAILLIKNRIQESGKDYQNKKLPAYSEGYKKKKALRNGAASVEITNLTLTGEMFREFKQVSAGLVNNNYVVSLGGKTKDSKDRFEWNSERYGDVLRIALQEEEILQETFDSELQRIIDQNDK